MDTSVPTVFISYSHKDVVWKERLVAHLGVPADAMRFDVWDDERIGVGQKWRAEIEQALATACAAVLLISVDFLRSQFIRDVEVPRLLRRRQDEGLPIIPVLVRSCAHDAVDWLSAIQMRPKGLRPLAAGTPHEIDEQLTALAKEIAGLVRARPDAQTAGERPGAPDQDAESDGDRIFGRADKIATILERLRQPGGQIVAIDGLGGVGKTTLAEAIVRRTERQAWLTVWATAKEQAFEDRGIEPHPLADPLTLDSFLHRVAQGLDCQDELRQASSQTAKLLVLGRHIKKRRCLLVMDNLETVAGYRSLISGLATLGTSGAKILLTSRPSLEAHGKVDAACHLEGLEEPASIAFLRHQLRSRLLSEPLEIADDVLRRIHVVTWGLPLAMKWIVGQLLRTRGSADKLLEQLGKIEAPDAQSAHVQLYRFIFMDTWRGLPKNAQKLLVSLGQMPAATPTPVEWIRRVSGLPEGGFEESLAEARVASLLEVTGWGPAARYSIHPLTRQFVASPFAR